MPLVQTAPIVLLAAFALPSVVYPFEFSYSPPRACDDLEITWTGGAPPFQLLIAPAFGTPRNYSIPNTSFDGTKGTFKTQLQMRPIGSQKVDQFLLTMSDANGFGTGGTSGVLTAGPSANGATCDLSDPGVAFTFELPSSLQQCRVFTFAQYTRAVQPVTIYGMIPFGTSFKLNPPPGSTEFGWNVNVAARTSLIVFMVDGQGRQGGASDLLTVSNTDEDGCLNANSPSSTASLTESTGGVSTTSFSSSIPNSIQSASPSTTSENDNGHGPMGAVIGGVIAGSIVTLVAIATLCMFLYKHRKSKGAFPFGRLSGGTRSRRRVQSVDLATVPSQVSRSPPIYPPQEYQATPFHLPPELGDGPQRQYEYSITPYSPFSGGGYSNGAPSPYGGDELASYNQTVSSRDHGSTVSGSEQYSRSGRSSITSKATMAGLSAGGYGPTRFVLHTDAGTLDEMGEEVVELPPTYNDVNGETAPKTPTVAEHTQSPTFSSHSSSGGASAVETQPHPLASSRSKPSAPPVLPSLDHRRDDLDLYDIGSGLALFSRSPPQSPRNTRHTQQQHNYPFASPSAQSGSSSQGPLSPR